jgi:hypothetical protein
MTYGEVTREPGHRPGSMFKGRGNFRLFSSPSNAFRTAGINPTFRRYPQTESPGAHRVVDSNSPDSLGLDRGRSSGDEETRSPDDFRLRSLRILCVLSVEEGVAIRLLNFPSPPSKNQRLAGVAIHPTAPPRTQPPHPRKSAAEISRVTNPKTHKQNHLTPTRSA